MIGIAVVGCGYWGPNLVRNALDTGRADVRWLCDLDAAAIARLAARYPTARTTSRIDDVLADGAVDAVCIATPPATHFPLAARALESGRHVWVEKPLTATSDDAERLIERAARAGRVLMVDHVFVYTPAVRKMREIVERGELGRILYFDSVRINLGLIQRDVNVVWDLAPHDLSILDFVAAPRVETVAAIGAVHAPARGASMAYVTLTTQEGMLVHLHLNWLAPVKVRTILLGGSDKMLVYDDMQASEKLKVYEKSIRADPPDRAELHRALIQYRNGDMVAPRLDNSEALRVAMDHFIDCIEKGATPRSDGHAGLRVVKLLEAADRSIAEFGRPVAV